MAISADSGYIHGAIKQVKERQTPPELRVGRRPLNGTAGVNSGQADAVSLSPAALKPQRLTLNPEIPEADDTTLAYGQIGSTEEVLFTMGVGNLRELRGLGRELYAENRLLQGEPVNV